jgi:hypothetical protein
MILLYAHLLTPYYIVQLWKYEHDETLAINYYINILINYFLLGKVKKVWLILLFIQWFCMPDNMRYLLYEKWLLISEVGTSYMVLCRLVKLKKYDLSSCEVGTSNMSTIRTKQYPSKKFIIIRCTFTGPLIKNSSDMCRYKNMKHIKRIYVVT